MPNSRKRHHSRSRSKSSDRSNERNDLEYKRKKYDEKNHDEGHRNNNSNSHSRKGSLSYEQVENGTTQETHQEIEKTNPAETVQESEDTKQPAAKSTDDDKDSNKTVTIPDSSSSLIAKPQCDPDLECVEVDDDQSESDVESQAPDKSTSEDDKTKPKSTITPFTTPKKTLTPRKLQQKLESEKKRLERQKEKEDREKKRNEEKQKRKEERQKEIEQKQKEKEMKEEQKKKEKEEKDEQRRKEKEEKELKRKEKEEKEEIKRKEREQEKIKKQQEIDEKNKEKLKEEEKKKKTAALFVNFFVPIKTDGQEEKKPESTESNFMAFEIKSDMKLPLPRRDSLTNEEKETLDSFLKHQNEEMSYLNDLKKCNKIRRCAKTWPYEESVEDDVTVVDLGESICEDKSTLQKFRAKFFKFHENRRPAYFGTWRKKSKTISARKPLSTDKELLNYEEDSDDDWEEEEQGESLNGSEDEAEKENEDEKDDYEVDNDFFVPHGHLSEDEVDDEENARLSPESLKQKLKLLKEEFDQDMKSKTNKLKPRSVGCIWYNKDGSNVDEVLNRYLQPLAIISNGQVLIKKRSEILVPQKYRKFKELDPEHVPLFLKIVQGNSNKKAVVVDQFIQHMEKNGLAVVTSKSHLMKKLKQLATWKRCTENGPQKNKFGWFVNKEIDTSNVDS